MTRREAGLWPVQKKSCDQIRRNPLTLSISMSVVFPYGSIRFFSFLTLSKNMPVHDNNNNNLGSTSSLFFLLLFLDPQHNREQLCGLGAGGGFTVGHVGGRWRL